jgi:hypothetical protein
MSIAALICQLIGHRFSYQGYDYFGKGGSMVCNRCAKEKGQ